MRHAHVAWRADVTDDELVTLRESLGLSNSARVSAGEKDPAAGNNTATETTLITR